MFVRLLIILLAVSPILMSTGCKKKATQSEERPAEGVHELDMSDDPSPETKDDPDKDKN